MNDTMRTRNLTATLAAVLLTALLLGAAVRVASLIVAPPTVEAR